MKERGHRVPAKQDFIFILAGHTSNTGNIQTLTQIPHVLQATIVSNKCHLVLIQYSLLDYVSCKIKILLKLDCIVWRDIEMVYKMSNSFYVCI